MKIKEVLERNPVIPAIKNDMYLEEAKIFFYLLLISLKFNILSYLYS